MRDLDVAEPQIGEHGPGDDVDALLALQCDAHETGLPALRQIDRIPQDSLDSSHHVDEQSKGLASRDWHGVALPGLNLERPMTPATDPRFPARPGAGDDRAADLR